MYTINKIQPRGYSNTDANKTSEGNTRNNRSTNHNNGSRRNNQLRNRALEIFTGEVPSVGSVPGTVAEQLFIKDQFKTCSSPRRPLFLHALSFECTSKLCINFLNQFSVYFHI